MPEGILDYSENPNMLVFSKSDVPGRDCNVADLSGTAERIVLTDNHPFSLDGFGLFEDWNVMGLHAKSIEYEREFTQTTPAPGEGNGCGWETIALPFDVQTIEHESKGELVSFAASENGAEGKPFWLYEADGETTWKAAEGIRAGVPYIIAMPEHEYYADEFRLGGKIRFSAKDVEIGRYTYYDRSVTRPDDVTFCAVTQPENSSIFVVNMGLNAYMDDCYDDAGNLFAPGSAFVKGVPVKPMHAGMAGAGDTRYLPVFGDESGVGQLYADDTLTVEPLRGAIRVISGSDRSVDVFTTTGLRVATLQLRAGEPALTDTLVPGVYIVAGRKVRVD